VGGQPSATAAVAAQPHTPSQVPEEVLNPAKKPRYAEIQDEINELPGQYAIKDTVEKVISNALLNKIRVEQGLEAEPLSYNMLITGNPGTGKTTVTKKMGQLFYELGVVAKPDVVSLKRPDLTGPWANRAAQQTSDVINKNKGKVIFIDEAYTLYNGPQDNEGRQVIDELMRLAEENRHDTVIVLAGYSEHMDRLFQANPGLKSRFGRRMDLPDYTPAEKAAVMDYMVREKQRTFHTKSAAKLARDYASTVPSGGESGNARAVRNFYERIVESQSERLLYDMPEGHKLTPKDLTTFTSDDVHRAATVMGLPKRKPARRVAAKPVAPKAQAGYGARSARRVARKPEAKGDLVAAG
jgi:Cdc6-like AAA superfamily ATPase